MVKVAVAGAAGRMGRMLARCAGEMEGVEVAGASECEGHELLGSDAGTVAGCSSAGVPLVADLGTALAQADVLIDFTFHEVAPANIAAARAAGKAVVIGTTGLTDEEAGAVRAAATAIPVVWAPNMSLGMNLLFEMVRKAASVLGPEYDAEIVEVHHRPKTHAPSGTALRLGESVAAGRGEVFRDITVFGREGIVGERPAGQLGIHAVRSGDVVGDHTVSFATDGERVELTHRATSRIAFANGALKAALWVCGRAPGLYDMRDVLGLA